MVQAPIGDFCGVASTPMTLATDGGQDTVPSTHCYEARLRYHPAAAFLSSWWHRGRVEDCVINSS